MLLLYLARLENAIILKLDRDSLEEAVTRRTTEQFTKIQAQQILAALVDYDYLIFSSYYLENIAIQTIISKNGEITHKISSDFLIYSDLILKITITHHYVLDKILNNYFTKRQYKSYNYPQKSKLIIIVLAVTLIFILFIIFWILSH